jgi:hypothetical protein
MAESRDRTTSSTARSERLLSSSISSSGSWAACFLRLMISARYETSSASWRWSLASSSSAPAFMNLSSNPPRRSSTGSPHARCPGGSGFPRMAPRKISSLSGASSLPFLFFCCGTDTAGRSYLCNQRRLRYPVRGRQPPGQVLDDSQPPHIRDAECGEEWAVEKVLSAKGRVKAVVGCARPLYGGSGIRSPLGNR